jgi:hypothetical protein
MTSGERSPNRTSRLSSWLTAGLLTLGLGYLIYRTGMDSALGTDRSGFALLPSVGDAPPL